MRLLLALACALALCAPGPTFSSPRPAGLAPRAVAAPGATRPSAPAVALVTGVSLDVGDLIVPAVIDFTIWISTTLMAFLDDLFGHFNEDLRHARAHGDAVGVPMVPDPTLVSPAPSAAPVPVSPSSELTP